MKFGLPAVLLANIFISPNVFSLDLIGQTQSQDPRNIVAEIDGVLASSNFESGDKVQINQVVATIKKQDFEFEVAKKQANVDLAKATLTLKLSIYQRYQELVRKNSLSTNDLDTAKAEFLNAKALLKLAEIELKEAEQNLNRTTIKANIQGFVVNRHAQVGTWVNQGDLLYELVNIERLTIQLMASEHDLQRLRVGQPIDLWTETSPGNKRRATIKRIGVEMDTNTLAYPIELDIDNHDYSLKPGMTIYATTKINQSANRPAQAPTPPQMNNL